MPIAIGGPEIRNLHADRIGYRFAQAMGFDNTIHRLVYRLPCNAHPAPYFCGGNAFFYQLNLYFLS
jgi:hypothetical protein